MRWEVNNIIYFKACPRCKGDIKVAGDLYGPYLECLQCGYEIEVKEASRLAKASHQAEERELSKVA